MILQSTAFPIHRISLKPNKKIIPIFGTFVHPQFADGQNFCGNIDIYPPAVYVNNKVSRITCEIRFADSKNKTGDKTWLIRFFTARD